MRARGMSCQRALIHWNAAYLLEAVVVVVEPRGGKFVLRRGRLGREASRNLHHRPRGTILARGSSDRRRRRDLLSSTRWSRTTWRRLRRPPSGSSSTVGCWVSSLPAMRFSRSTRCRSTAIATATRPRERSRIQVRQGARRHRPHRSSQPPPGRRRLGTGRRRSSYSRGHIRASCGSVSATSAESK